MRALESYGESHAVRSATTGREFIVRREGDRWHCDCEFVKHYPGRACRHILQVLNDQLTLERDIAQKGYVDAALSDFEGIVDRMAFFRSGETRHLGGLTMSLAAHHPAGTVSADEIYAAVGGASGFDGDPRILGVVVAQLKKKGLLAEVGYRHSKRNNARPILSLRITDKGREFVSPHEPEKV